MLFRLRQKAAQMEEGDTLKRLYQGNRETFAYSQHESRLAEAVKCYTAYTMCLLCPIKNSNN